MWYIILQKAKWTVTLYSVLFKKLSYIMSGEPSQQFQDLAEAVCALRAKGAQDS